MKHWKPSLCTAIAVLTVNAIVIAEEKTSDSSWKNEVDASIWFATAKGGVKADGRTEQVDESFDDIGDHADLSGSLRFASAYNDEWVMLSRADYFDLTDHFKYPEESGKTTIGMYVLTAAAGFRFHNGITDGSRIDMMIGFQYLSLDSKISVHEGRVYDDTAGFADAVLMLRPDIPLSESWSLETVMSVGGGDSRVVYDLQSQFQYSFNERWRGHIGYRKTYFDLDDSGVGYKGYFSGFIVGLGVVL